MPEAQGEEVVHQVLLEVEASDEFEGEVQTSMEFDQVDNVLVVDPEGAVADVYWEFFAAVGMLDQN